MIFPVECLGCGKNHEDLPAHARWICPACTEKISLKTEQTCPYCEKASEGGETHRACRGKTRLDGLWAACHYDGFVERAIYEYKFNFIRDISYPLGEIMAKSVREAPEFGEFQEMTMINRAKEEEEGLYVDEVRNERRKAVIVPVPLHKKRYNWRGFNQSYLLSKKLGEGFGLPVREDLLMRAKNTKPQSKTKSGEERWRNIDRAFTCPHPEEAEGKDVILVDDICTTSATLSECAKELKAAGARHVWGLVVARR